jgi:hypothetical protein
MSEKISLSVMRALRAVARGEVVKKVGRRNSKMITPKGVGELAIWRLMLAKLITDGPKSGARTVTYKQILTEAGEAALKTGMFQA